MSWLEDRKRSHSAKEIAKVIWPYVTKRRGFLVFVSIVSFFAAIIGLVTPLLVREVINTAIPESNLVLVWIIGASVLGVALVGGLLQYVSRFYAAKYAQEVIFDLRNDIYEILQKLSSWERKGRNPFILTASVIYLAEKLLAKELNHKSVFTQELISKATNIAEYSIRDHYVKVLKPRRAGQKKQDDAPEIAP